ncbi:MAG: AraC family transcriptional regulator [Verrucomicrobia bacterium]|nr:AraC family transcriptional regulator [Verrucomicrobiota bacterium]
MSFFLDAALDCCPEGIGAWNSSVIACFLPKLCAQVTSASDELLRTHLLLPASLGCYSMVPEHLFHPTPEVFVQLSGATWFEFPAASARLNPAQIAVVPSGLPHRETIVGKKNTFANLVMMFQSGSFTVHIAYANKLGAPQGTAAVTWQSPLCQRLIDYLDHMTGSDLSISETTKFALLRACFGTVSALVASNPIHSPPHPSRINRCIHLIQMRLADPELSVPWLAGELNCSPDYLSHTFSKATGERLSQFINRQRVAVAASLLRGSDLGVAQVAYAVGYRHAGYFIRQFRTFMAVTPLTYRESAGR